MRVDNDVRELDKGSCDMMLRIIRAESQERALLCSMVSTGNGAGGGASGSKKQPGGTTVGDAK